MTDSVPPFALLLAAHGERRDGAGNEGVARLAVDLAGRGLAAEVGIGFIKGTPSIAETLAGFATGEVVVYPLFLSDGYFARRRLPQLIESGQEASAARRRVHVLPPLGVDPALVDLVADEARRTADSAHMAAAAVTLVLLAHGTPRDPASRQAAEVMVQRLAATRRFYDVCPAFLEEPPSLAQALDRISGPVVVVGLFAGEGLHGGDDAPQLVREAVRADVVFAGNVGTFTGIADVIAAAVRRASTDGDERVK
ncbi:CbiX/SirB N-terminal domain-containing protein [Xanthobacteraceae bacterium Astr-EGSB]|uniref:CbiX/SirB N-terminal domain-containing protein n=1 Tax=Astrobacterium formosum TaxID=3069710 RepID=UPI0027B2110D|nr:CbiX/SirB N-terminal domain-containing protein [Xanthobacteraceae bacterium Astr-EGSB]